MSMTTELHDANTSRKTYNHKTTLDSSETNANRLGTQADSKSTGPPFQRMALETGHQYLKNEQHHTVKPKIKSSMQQRYTPNYILAETTHALPPTYI
jgi:hypothetical protein